MSPLPVTAIFGKPCKAKSDLTSRLLAIDENHTVIRFGESGEGNPISQILNSVAAVAGQGASVRAILDIEGGLNPLMLAQAFETSDPQGNSFSRVAYLAAAVTVIETESFLSCILPDATPGDIPQGYPNDLAEQLEVSDFIVLQPEKSLADSERAQALARCLNPRAVVTTPAAGRETLEAMLDGKYDGRAAQLDAGWQQLLQGRNAFEQPAQAVGAFVFEARRPFHPARLSRLLRGALPGVFRVKGFFWLATRMSQVLGVSKAGWEARFGMVGQWWATVGRDQWPPIPEFRAEIEKKWSEPYGDRQQAIVLMGVGANFEEITRSFAACLLDDTEMEAGESAWTGLEDPFPAWTPHHHHHHEEHDHECCGHDHGEHDEAEHHDCCGHH